MLDVHILTMSYTPAADIERCLESVRLAAELAPFDVQVHVLEGVYGHLGQQRKRGYSQGLNQYVTSVDDDDWVEPTAFSVLPLNDKPFAVTTSEYAHTGTFKRISHKPHHLAVYSRNWLQRQPYERLKFFPDQFLLTQAGRDGDIIHIPVPQYHHVVTPSSGSRKQRAQANQAEIEAERAIVTNPELLYWEGLSFSDIASEIDKELNDGVG